MRMRVALERGWRTAWLVALVGGLSVAVLGGCSGPPNVGPFVDGTIQLRAAVAAAGQTAADELRSFDASTSQADELEAQWRARDRAMQALTVYAASLQAIVSSGQSGAQAADNVAQSLSSLAASVGVVPGGSEAVALATDSAKFVYQQIARVRAAKSLEKAMVEAQPAIEEIATLLQEDFDDLLVIFRAGNQLARLELSDEFGDLIGYRDTLAEDIAAADIRSLDAAGMEQLGRTSALFAETETWYRNYIAKESELDARLRIGRQLIVAASLSTREWAAAHQHLVVALRSRQPVDGRSLLIAAVELRQLVKRAREL